jgi:predicted nucleic acid-binding protein
MSQRIRLDANVILRFLRNDDPKQSPAAARLFEKGGAGAVNLFVTAVTINEVFFALTSFYKLSHPDAAKRVLPFVRAGAVEFEEEECLVDALQRVISEEVDFGDAYLAASAVGTDDLVASFDRDLRRFKDVQLYDLEGNH